MSKVILPRENLFRAVYAVLPVSDNPPPAVSMRDADDDEGEDGRTLQLQWYVANRWTEIRSFWEGHFMERIALGAARKTIKENRANMRILLQHGYDPSIGEKPIAPVDTVEENDLGGYAEGRLFDGLDPLVVDGLRAGQYGASFRFSVMREEIEEEPGESEHNPKGLPERTIKEMRVMEFGPVTWGAYSEASAGVRSITDEVHFGALRGMPAERLSEIADFWRSVDSRFFENSAIPDAIIDAPSEGTPAVVPAPTSERREDKPRPARSYLSHEATVPSWRLS
jgi:phage head maturation protease